MTGPTGVSASAKAGSLVDEQTWQPIGVKNLEPAAWDALRDPGCTAVTAGPGAGKTEFLAQRAAYLLQTGLCPAPRRILAISYKRDSAANLARRVEARVPEHAGRLVSTTFDSFTKGLVDRFRSALPQGWALHGAYDMKFPTRRDRQDFLAALPGRVAEPHKAEIRSLTQDSFFNGVLGTLPLPADPTATPATVAEFAVLEWWRKQYLRAGAQHLDFTMVNRLADLIVRSTPHLLHALQLTYPFVFVDEFQDTTGAQLSLLGTVFTGTAITAVGDPKQRIMGFAGALPDAFDDYTAAFEAQPYALVWNFRSSAELVLLQHVIAVRLDPAAVPAVSKAAVEEGHVPASLWTYPNAAREAAHVAEWIAGDIANSGRAASGFALVARQKVADYEPLLIAELEANGVKLRNDDARYGTSSLQDLLKHDVTRVLLGILKLAAEPNGLGDVWLDVTATMARIRGEDDDVVASRALSDELARSTRDLRSWLASTPPEPAAAAAAAVWAAGIVGLEQLKGYAESRHHGENVDDLYASFTGRLSHVLAGADSWSQAFIDVEAEDAVTLLTIHRSKGLEYHTVFFLGLDEGQWWSYKYDVDEAISAFFVGLSRAAQRLIFTCTDWGAESGEISELYAMLDAAGVKRQTWS